MLPDDLAGAYAIQDRGIDLWADRLVGWKVGYIPVEKRERSGADRLLGPIWAGQTAAQQGSEPAPFEVFGQGFAAVEAEFVLRMEADQPTDRVDWTAEQARAHPATLLLGMEVASSPLPDINDLGPLVITADFGNNNGLLLGPEIANWTELDEIELVAETEIDGSVVGRATAAQIPGGLGQAFAFALSTLARRGRPLLAGQLVATGNITGIHPVQPGSVCRVSAPGWGALTGQAVQAAPRS
ncbi:2-keto-4-pentenoate hydratase [Microlunatus panaciterrae]|uniref:2-keto-4-pentenoate hydratase n=1 Tax=Microlunatus panaciterrae TaxID=400768 RepID=A0ABS2RLX4_9ACTN|nr:fumarylacetoacetate hydrolase family protein [Microlunatus panaciterrae]MBM7799587.1 2-keto-4-pentenoate hydratase [Microlunatus panaciterrae]